MVIALVSKVLASTTSENVRYSIPSFTSKAKETSSAAVLSVISDDASMRSVSMGTPDVSVTNPASTLRRVVLSERAKWMFVLMATISGSFSSMLMMTDPGSLLSGRGLTIPPVRDTKEAGRLSFPIRTSSEALTDVRDIASLKVMRSSSVSRFREKDSIDGGSSSMI